MAFEVDYLLGLDESGIITYIGDEAISNNVTEWLNTPRGHVYGRPEWGNQLASLKHEPPNEDTAVAMENSILLGMQLDLPQLQVSGILCTPDAHEPDIFRVQIQAQQGFVDAIFRL